MHRMANVQSNPANDQPKQRPAHPWSATSQWQAQHKARPSNGQHSPWLEHVSSSLWSEHPISGPIYGRHKPWLAQTMAGSTNWTA